MNGYIKYMVENLLTSCVSLDTIHKLIFVKLNFINSTIELKVLIQ